MTTTLSQPTAGTIPASTANPRLPSMLGLLYAVIAATAVQIAAGLAGIDPSPPADLLPFIAATAALGIAAVPMVRADQRSGYVLGIGFCAVSMVGMGPHKLLLDDGLVIAPMALVGFAFEVAFIRLAVASLRGRA